MEKQSVSKRSMLAEAIWCYLTSPVFTNSKRAQRGLGNLVVKIFDYLSDKSKMLLACAPLVTSLLREYSQC
jgi:hypothetical protein